MPKKSSPLAPGDATLRDRFDTGTQNFARLFTKWMDTNGWSHPIMVSLATACLELPDGKGWLHSSQISGLRHAKLISPGPRTFLAIERLNAYLHRYATTRTLLPGTTSSNYYADPFVITEDGAPPPLGWWVEVFCGARVPKDVDVAAHFISEKDAAVISANWAKLIRRLLISEGLDLVDDLGKLIREHYPVGDVARIGRLASVIQGQLQLTPDEFLYELPAITAFTGALGGPSTEDELLAATRK